MPNHVLITGDTGFVGSALCSHLWMEDTITVIHRDSNRTFPPPNCDFIKVLNGDITDFDFMRRVIADEEINDIYHCAANSIVRTCAQDPLTAYEINVMGTVKLLEAVRQVGMNNIKSILVSTSDKVYGHSPSPYTETTPFLPKYTYEATKACQDIVCQNYFHNYGLPVKVVRCSNVYGPGDPNYSRIIPNTIRRISAGMRPVLHSGVAAYVREFVYIDDVVDAFKLVNDTAPPGEVYCVGGTGSINIAALVQKILDLCASDLEIEFQDKASNFKEIETQYIDSTKLRTLGWEPQIALEQGLRRAIKYYGN